MRTVLRWSGRILGGLVVLLLLAAGVVYGVSARILRHPAGIAGNAVPIPTDSASIAEGARLAEVKGCTGCHGQQLQGALFVDDPLIGRLVSPPLPALARRAETADLERAIRQGVGGDGRPLVAMPSEMFYHLSDTDLGRIIAHLRSVPDSAMSLPTTSLRLARVFFVLGKFKTAYALVPQDRPRLSEPPTGDMVALGEYVARTTCTECHGLDLEGDPEFKVPGLAIAAGYSDEEFATLMRTGIAKGGRELGLMTQVARGRLVHLTGDEVTGLKSYLSSLAAAPAGPVP